MGKKKIDSYNGWREDILKKSLDKSPLRKSLFETSSGIVCHDVYAPELEKLLENIGFPGEYPFTRGIHATMYRSRPWTMRQYAGFGTAVETNERFRYLLSQGITGLSVAFDLPTQMGRDADHAQAVGEVGRVGVSISTLDDMDELFSGIPIEKVSTSMTINSTAHILLALYLSLAKKRGVSWKNLRGTVQNDVLKEYIARGTYIYPPKPALKIVTDVIEFCKTEVPEWNTISISGYHIREAGSTAVQEVAFTLANGITYVEAAIARGMNIDDFAPRLAFFFNCHNNFLEEVSKFRAARRLWARIMKERFSAKNPASMMLRFHTQTAGSTLTAQQPEVNIVRTTIQALAAVLGGTQSLHTNGYDEALGLPTEETARIALRTQQIIANESGVADFVDPLGGSYVIEELTNQIEIKASEIIDHVGNLGGMVTAIEQYYPQKEIEDAAYRHQLALEKGETKVVSVNIHTEGEKADKKIISSLNPKLESERCDRLKAWKEKRDKKQVNNSRENLLRVASEGGNIMPSVVSSVEAGVTLGEISDTLRQCYGEHRA